MSQHGREFYLMPFLNRPQNSNLARVWQSAETFGERRIAIRLELRQAASPVTLATRQNGTSHPLPHRSLSRPRRIQPPHRLRNLGHDSRRRGPDLDVLWAFRGPVAALQHHRGITHTFLGAPFVALAVTGTVFLWHRFGTRKKMSILILEKSGCPILCVLCEG